MSCMTARVPRVWEAMGNGDNAGCGLLRVSPGCEWGYSVCNMWGRNHAGDTSLGGWWGAITCMGLWKVPGSGGRARRESSDHVRDGRCSRDGGRNMGGV